MRRRGGGGRSSRPAAAPPAGKRTWPRCWRPGAWSDAGGLGRRRRSGARGRRPAGRCWTARPIRSARRARCSMRAGRSTNAPTSASTPTAARRPTSRTRCCGGIRSDPSRRGEHERHRPRRAGRPQLRRQHRRVFARRRSPTRSRRRSIRRRPAWRCWSTRPVAERSPRARDAGRGARARGCRASSGWSCARGEACKNLTEIETHVPSGWRRTATIGAPRSSASAAAPRPTTPGSRRRSTCAAFRSRSCRRRCWRWSTRRWAARPASIWARARTWWARSTSRARSSPTSGSWRRCPRASAIAGLAEVVKCGFIADAGLLDLLEQRGPGAVAGAGSWRSSRARCA